MTMFVIKQLTVQAPRRMSVELGEGTFYTIPWTLEGVKHYRIDAGGHFITGHHDFDSKETASKATRRKG